MEIRVVHNPQARVLNKGKVAWGNFGGPNVKGKYIKIIFDGLIFIYFSTTGSKNLNSGVMSLVYYKSY